MIGSMQACKLPVCDFTGPRTPKEMNASHEVPRDSGTHNLGRRFPQSTFSLLLFEKRIPTCFDQFRGDFAADSFHIAGGPSAVAFRRIAST